MPVSRAWLRAGILAALFRVVSLWICFALDLGLEMSGCILSGIHPFCNFAGISWWLVLYMQPFTVLGIASGLQLQELHGWWTHLHWLVVLYNLTILLVQLLYVAIFFIAGSIAAAAVQSLWQRRSR